MTFFLIVIWKYLKNKLNLWPKSEPMKHCAQFSAIRKAYHLLWWAQAKLYFFGCVLLSFYKWVKKECSPKSFRLKTNI